MGTRRLKYTSFLILSLSLIVFLASSFTFSSFGMPETLTNAFKKGNYKEVSKSFDETIELEILDHEGIYSKTQAEQVLKTFFIKNAPSDFSIVHEGGRETSLYVIAIIKTSNGNYRINFLFKSKKILQLRIESENGNK